jgi:hypothetical protein
MGLGFTGAEACTSFCSIMNHAKPLIGDELLMSFWALFGLGGRVEGRPRPSLH